MFRNGRLVAAAILFCAATSAAPASAATITVTNVQVPYSQTIVLHDGIYGAGNSDTIGIAGQIQLTTNIGVLGTWCVDLFHYIYLGGSYTYTAGPLVTDNTGSSPASSNVLTALQIQTIQKLAAYGNGVMASAPSNVFSAALQAAIWNTEYNTTATGADPQFAITLANIMTVLPTLPAAYGYQLFNQNADGVYQSQGQFVVPEPATGALFGSALAAIAVLRRRRRAKA